MLVEDGENKQKTMQKVAKTINVNSLRMKAPQETQKKHSGVYM